MKVYIVGTGMDGELSLTNEGRTAIERSDIIIGAKRVTEPFLTSGKKVVCCYEPLKIAEILKESGCKTAAVLMSGDCGFFSGAKKLIPLLNEYDVRLISGISSAVYFCNAAGISYEDMKFISLHGRDASIALNVKMNEKCFFLLGSTDGAANVCKRLSVYGLSDVKVYIGENLGYENERIISGRAYEFLDIKTDKLCVLVTENKDLIKSIPSGIDDSFFTRGKVPMTKSEVRSIIISKLCICYDSIVWDIGCGTGSVSIEAAFRCVDGKVYSFDKAPEALRLTSENAKKAGCDNIEIYEGECPEILDDKPMPDRVFIGGSSGRMDDIIKTVLRKNSRAVIVVSAVSLETLYSAKNAFERNGLIYDIVNIAVTRTRTLGSYTMPDTQNPVFILWGRKK